MEESELTAVIAFASLLCLVVSAHAEFKYVFEELGINSETTEVTGYYGLAALLSYLLWYFIGRERVITPIACIYPPEELTPVDVGYIMNRRDRKDEIIALIIYWAEKGYLYISETIGNKRLQLHKIREPDEDTKHEERYLFIDIFCRKNVVEADDSIQCLTNVHRVSAYSNEEKLRIRRIIDGLPKVLLVGAPSIFCLWRLIFIHVTESVLQTSFLTAIFVTIVLMIIYSKEVRHMDKVYAAYAFLLGVFMLGLTSIFIAFYATSILVIISSKEKRHRDQVYTAYAFLLILFVYYLATTTPTQAILPIFKNVIITMFEIADLFLPLLLMAKCTINMRTGLEREYIAYLEGFKDSIREYNTHGQTNSSQYFYNVLPYAMTLGMKDELVRKYENIVFYPPKWLKSSESGKTFSVSSFVSRLYEGM